MIFFTDISTQSSKYCLLNIKHYEDPRKEKKRLIFIDPGVIELKKQTEYSHIKQLHNLIENNTLGYFEWISIDYPCDMLLEKGKARKRYHNYVDLFLEKSIKNNLKYKNKRKYICAIQSRFLDFEDFKKQFEYLKPIFHYKEKIVGIGNLCRIKYPNNFTDKIFSFLKRNQDGISHIHFYGLSKQLIEEYLSYTKQKPLFGWYSPWPWRCVISVDSTKWTRAVIPSLKEKYDGRVCCRAHNRSEFLETYCQELEKKTSLWV